jgi:hypothetical protein
MKNQTMIKSTVSKFSLPFLALLPGVLLATSAVTAHAQNLHFIGGTGGIPAEVQSPNMYFGQVWEPIAPVMKGGSDQKSAVFQTEVLPEMQKFLNRPLAERSKLEDSRILLDDMAMVNLKTTSDVRMYFVGENSGATVNSLSVFNGGGFNTEQSFGRLGQVFPSVTSPVSTNGPANTAERTLTAPLLPGDFVNLGEVKGGSGLQFGFFTYFDDNNNHMFDQYPARDGFNHFAIIPYHVPNSPYLIFGLEDTFGGGDQDYNDMVFALDIGAGNVKAVTSAPEPAMALTLVSFLGMTLRRKRSFKLA